MKIWILAVLALVGCTQAQTQTRSFQMVTVDLSGTKIWLPSTVVVNRGDTVEFEIVSRAGEGTVHGFQIQDYGVEEVADTKGKKLRLRADKAGVFRIGCHLHPPHIGAQLIVLD